MPNILGETQADRQELAQWAAGNEYLYRRIFDATGDGLLINDVETGLVVEANPTAVAMHGYKRLEFLGLHPSDYIHPDSLPLLAESIRAVRAGGGFTACLEHLRRDGGQFSVEAHGTRFLYQERPCLLSVIRDVSERVEAERLLRRHIKDHLREQATLLEISQTLASALELHPELILDQLRVVIEYTHAALFAVDGLDLVALAVRGPQALEAVLPLHLQLDGPEVLTTLLNKHRPTWISAVEDADPAALLLHKLLVDQAAILLEGVRSCMWVPLAVKGHVIGGIVVAHVEQDSFTAHQANLALIIANQAAITMVNARLYEQAQTLAALEERQRLAQNLHDAVNQSLFSAGLIAEVLPRLWERSPDEGRQALEDLRRLTRGALAEMRGLLAELQPLVLTDTDLGDLLHQLGNALTGRTSIPVLVTVRGECDLPAEVQVILYRLCQEALTNIAKHAGASHVTVTLQCDVEEVTIHIRDDGCGFDAPHSAAGHYGLNIMHDRARSIGAQLTVSSQPAHGTEIVIYWQSPAEREAP